ncbi:guanylate-binding protein (plasmid) [Clostridium botulinum A2B7 92]|uniref:guanylate-binding protein n=1 Tax=Clostridium botulinum TaxID=1491 RepID=UPI0007DE8487|nr:guanylate-binding protein [Clostridium botulinum]KEI94254.1 guanylate-binding protein [Clostridium botulinum A2B7 92]
MDTIDFKRARLKKRNKYLEKNYLKAEQIISAIKSEYMLILKGISKDDTSYKQLLRKFDALEFDLPNYWFFEFSNRLYMSLLALESVYEVDEELREEAKKQFEVEHEVLTLLNMEHGLKDIKFREEYIKEVKKEWSEE